MRVTAFVVCAAFVCAGANLPAQDKKSPQAAKKAAPAAAAPSDAEVIRKASSGAPAAIGKDATIIAMSADMKMRTVRKGTNGYTCMVAGPGPDAMCADENAMAWFDAYMNKKDPPKDKIGFVYMLAG